MKENMLKAGFGRTCITPTEPVPLAGFGNTDKRMHLNVRDDLFATCIAFADAQGTMILVYSLDLILISDDVTERIREGIEKTLSIPGKHVFLCCTHTHSGPDIVFGSHPAMQRYNDMLVERAVAVAKEAAADCKEAEMYYGSVKAAHMNFVKHYQNTDKDGVVHYFGDNFGTSVMDKTTKHITDADPTMHLVKITRDGCKDIVLANWRAHPTLTGGLKRRDLSADFPGTFRDEMEAKLHCHFAFLQGAQGNMNANSRIMDEEISRDVLVYGRVLASYAMEGLQNMKKLPVGPIRTKQLIMAGTIDHSKDHMVPLAEQVLDVWQKTNDSKKVLEFCIPLGIRSQYNATSIIRRANKPATADLELNAVSIGDCFSFVTAPNELFDTLSVMTEEGSPFPVTLTLGLTGAYRGYIPSKFGYEYTCYESDATWFAPGIGEEIVKNFIAMLKELREN